MVGPSQKYWSTRLNDALWGYRTTFKTQLECLLTNLCSEKLVIYQWNLSIVHIKPLKSQILIYNLLEIKKILCN